LVDTLHEYDNGSKSMACDLIIPQCCPVSTVQLVYVYMYILTQLSPT